MTNPETTTTKRDIDWQRLIEVALDTPGSLGDVYNRFYEYSFLNQMFLRMQGVQEPVATYKRWQAIGRQVLRGSKAHAVIRPIVIDKKNEAGEVEDRLHRFKLVRCLFGVSQTDGDDLPPAEPRGWDLNRAMAALDIERVPFTLLNGNIQGFSVGRELAINPVAADPLRTTFHELGHIVLGHTALKPEAVEDYREHRGIKEFQAEATAHLALNETGNLSAEAAAHSRGYIQHWLAEERPSDGVIRAVFAATGAILKAGREPVTAEIPTHV